jgi:hypothetical protein
MKDSFICLFLLLFGIPEIFRFSASTGFRHFRHHRTEHSSGQRRQDLEWGSQVGNSSVDFSSFFALQIILAY